MKNSFFTKIFIFGLITCFFACKPKAPNPTDCKIASINFSALEINTKNQITGLNFGTLRITYEYNSDGKIIKNNFFSSNGQISSYFDFVWTSNTITKTEFYRNSQGIMTQREQIIFELDAQNRIFKVNLNSTDYYRYEYNTDGNVVKCYGKGATFNNGVEFLSVEYTKFDNKLNPYFRDSALGIYMIDGIGNGFHQCKNNVIEAKYYNTNGTLSHISQYAHEYNSLGFPTVIKSSSGNILYFGYNCR